MLTGIHGFEQRFMRLLACVDLCALAFCLVSLGVIVWDVYSHDWAWDTYHPIWITILVGIGVFWTFFIISSWPRPATQFLVTRSWFALGGAGLGWFYALGLVAVTVNYYTPDAVFLIGCAGALLINARAVMPETFSVIVFLQNRRKYKFEFEK